jgi:hypothetical protein
MNRRRRNLHRLPFGQGQAATRVDRGKSLIGFQGCRCIGQQPNEIRQKSIVGLCECQACPGSLRRVLNRTKRQSGHNENSEIAQFHGLCQIELRDRRSPVAVDFATSSLRCIVVSEKKKIIRAD